MVVFHTAIELLNVFSILFLHSHSITDPCLDPAFDVLVRCTESHLRVRPLAQLQDALEASSSPLIHGESGSGQRVGSEWVQGVNRLNENKM